MGSTNLLTITPANIITVCILGLLGYGILVGASKAYTALTGNSVGGG
jgi:hypothetical protein